MPSSLRNVAVLHSTLLVLLLVAGIVTASLPVFGLVSLVFLVPLGPLLFLDRPLMWHLAKNAAYLFAFLSGVWVMYSALDIAGAADVLRVVLLALLAVYLIGVGGYLKSAAIRSYFSVRRRAQAAGE